MKPFPIYLGIAAALVLAGCSSSKTVTTPGTATTGTPAAAAPCATSALAGSLGEADGTAGTVYYPINLRNTGGSPCTLQGYAGVWFVAGADNHRVGKAAQQEPGAIVAVTLSPGDTATTTLGIVEAGNFGCQTTPVNGLQVSPPGQTASLVIAHADTACADPSFSTLHVGPLARA